MILLEKARKAFSIKVKFTLFTVLIGLVSFGIAAHFSSWPRASAR